MKRILTAGLLGASLALSPVAAAPAAAQSIDQERLMQVLGGLVILGLAGKAYNDRKDRKERREAAPVQRREAARDERGRYGHGARADRRVIPARCVRNVETPRGTRNLVGKRCLQRQGITRGLPDRCQRNVTIGHRDRPAYGLRCMRQQGWRVARHR